MAQITKKLVAQALAEKGNPYSAYAKLPDYGGINYEGPGGIYFWARRYFPEYSKLYKTNEEFVKYFSRDLNNNAPELLEAINTETELVSEQTTPSGAGQETTATPSETTAGETPASMTGGISSPTPRTFPTVTHAPEQAVEPETPKIEVANKTGVVAETPPASILVADKGGIVTREHPIITPAAPSESESPKIHIANPTSTSSQKVNWQGFRMPPSITSGAKNLGSAAQRFTGTNLNRIGRSLGGMLKGTVGAGGPALGNLGLNSIKVGGDFLGKLSSARNSVSKISPTRFGAKGLGTGKKVALAFSLFGLFFGFSLISGIVNPDETPTGQAAPIGPSSTGNINSCLFTRGDQNPTATGYQSPKLLGFFQEAQQKTSVPATVLAAIARVESPSATSLTDESLASMACAKSPTGALGLMQIQPPGTRGAFSAGIDLGASFIGKTVDQLTEADFCDPRTSIILSAGFILKKLHLGYGIGDGTKWEPAWNNSQDIIYKVASGYYGCLEYGGGDPLKCTGPYNYGSDLWTSIQSCQPSAATSSGGVIPAGQGGTRIASAAKQIAQQLVHSTSPGMLGCDPGGTYGPSYHCWSEMASYDQASDPDYLQCTEFVWAAFDKAGYGNQINEIRGGNAGDWPEQAKNSQSFSVFNDPSQLQVGDIISLGQGGIVSHVAIVIERSGNQVKVAQSATSAVIETAYIDNSNNLIVPGASRARTGIKGFIRLKGGTP